MINAGKDVGRNVNEYNRYGRQHGDFSEITGRSAICPIHPTAGNLPKHVKFTLFIPYISRSPIHNI